MPMYVCWTATTPVRDLLKKQRIGQINMWNVYLRCANYEKVCVKKRLQGEQASPSGRHVKVKTLR
jgi:hypothetical protein